jgi:uncharacterized membrane protein YphA (DoxX/SURF4 family)
MILRIIHWASRIILAGIFLYSGYVKYRNPLQFSADLTAYKLFPAAIIIPVSQYFPWVEMVLGAALLVGWRLRYFALGTVGLVAFFIAIMAITYARGIDANCGCFGSGDKISPLTIARDASFILPAIFLAWEGRIRRRWQRRAA